MSNKFKNALNQKLIDYDFSPNFTNKCSLKIFNKVNTSTMLKNSNCYPETFIIKNQNELNNILPKLNGYYFIKPKYGERGRNISLVNNSEFIIKKDIKFPIIIQKEIIPKLIRGYKVDYRVYVLYVKLNNKVSSYFFPYGLIRKCNDKYSDNKNEDNSLVSSGKGVVQVNKEEIIKCLQNAQNSIIPHLNSTNNREIEICITGYDLIEDINGKYWILEINSKPCFFHNKVVTQIHKEIIEDIELMVKTKRLDKFSKLID